MLLAWVVVGVALAAFELHHLAFYALFGAAGAFAAAAVAIVAPGAVGLQVIVAIVVAAIGIVVARPYVSRIVHRRGDGHVARGVHGGLVGAHAVTIDVVGDAARQGHVRLAGEQWLAISGDGQPVAAGTDVLVTAVSGTTLTVWPANPIPGVPRDLDLPAVTPSDAATPSDATANEETNQPTNEVT